MNDPHRDHAGQAFLAKHHWDDAAVIPLQADASQRRYFRLRKNSNHGATAMLMDAPPPLENVALFATVTQHLEKIGARVPAIHAMDSDNGFLLLEDLGESTFTRLIAEGHDEATLYQLAIQVLARINQHPRATDINLPRYTIELALTESNLLLDWYIPARLKRRLNASARREFQQLWADIFGALIPLAPALVLRDCHMDNLMLVGGDCALLDYQDAVIGSPAYDLVSLLEDARRDSTAALTADMMKLYCAQNPTIERHTLHQHYLVWGAQRHCKVAGIFTRLWLRDRKDVYLRHLPRVMKLLQRHLHEPALHPLRSWLDEHLGNLNHAPFDAPATQLLRHCKT